MMRSLVITLNSATAASGGAGMRNAQTVRSLARHGPVDVVSLGVTETGPTPNAATSLEWSWDDLDSGKRRWDRLRSRAWPVLPGSHWRQNMYLSPAAMSLVQRMADEHHHDLVVAAAWQTSPYVLRARRSGRLVLDTHNVEADLRRSIEAPAQGHSRSAMQRIDQRRLVSLERRLGNRADQVWTCSEADARLWRQIHGRRARLHVVPNTVAEPRRVVAHHERIRHRLLLTGTFSYRPNIDAARELVHDILPRVRDRLPETTVELVGREPGPEVVVLDGGGVTVVGPVPEMAPYLGSASVMVVPLRSGGGTRLKILEAMAAGLPVVSTAKGVEGIEAVAGDHLLVADRPQELADAVVKLCTEPALAIRLSTAARELVHDRYGEGALDRAVDRALDALGLMP